jgi:hypothetical protein
MTAVQLNMDIQNKLGLFSDNINVLEKISKFLDSLIAKKKDESLMTKDEFFAMLDKSSKQAEEGKVHCWHKGESIEEYVKRIENGL